ncbi:glutamate 5-kinase [Algirhabdus cladophorae]|uniref:glutamate 5-kinase n=1 Tax=Algirhabdus cladophorae TaxID=3377108 RepID=UPI003B846086
MEALRTPKRLVVKIGSALLVDAAAGVLKSAWLNSLVADAAQLKEQGVEVVFVSSGSIALGRHLLGLPAGALALEQSQAAAAVGQIHLARAYDGAFEAHGIRTAQVLLTLEDSADRRRYLNTRATLEQLLGLGVVPIVNENDTVATDEIRYGDNDRLAAQVAVTIGADQLVLLSDVDGLYTGDPNMNSGAQHIDVVQEITFEIEAMAGDAASGLSKGGMKTKVMAAKMATDAGCAMAITLGLPEHCLSALYDDAKATWFMPKDDPQLARKRWIAAMPPKGVVTLDAGAAKALLAGKSLLPAGVTDVAGEFGRGDPVAIERPDGTRLGVGLVRYASAEAHLIAGRQSQDIEAALGYPGRAALIHRDDMVV